MRRPRLLFALLALVLIAAIAPPSRAAAGEGPSFRRGINLSHLFVFPQPGWPPFRGVMAQVSDAELARLSSLGLDFIRLPIDPTPFIDASGEQRRALTDDIVAFVRRARAAGLSVMISGYTIDGDRSWRPERPAVQGSQDFEDYARWLEMVSVALAAAVPKGVAVELMNEPQAACVATATTDWASYQSRLHARLRALVDLPIVLTGGCWSRIDGLLRLALIPDDPNTLFDVHYYAPFTYTHQGATWATPILAYVGGLRFPPQESRRDEAVAAVAALIAERHRGSPAEAERLRAEAMREVDAYIASGFGPAGIAEDFVGLARWARRHGIAPHRILIGEFGAIRHRFAAHAPSRAHYLAEVRLAAERHGFGWAMWEYFASFGLLEDDAARLPVPAILDALGLGGPMPREPLTSPRRRERP